VAGLPELLEDLGYEVAAHRRRREGLGGARHSWRLVLDRRTTDRDGTSSSRDQSGDASVLGALTRPGCAAGRRLWVAIARGQSPCRGTPAAGRERDQGRARLPDASTRCYADADRSGLRRGPPRDRSRRHRPPARSQEPVYCVGSPSPSWLPPSSLPSTSSSSCGAQSYSRRPRSGRRPPEVAARCPGTRRHDSPAARTWPRPPRAGSDDRTGQGLTEPVARVQRPYGRGFCGHRLSVDPPTAGPGLGAEATA
jgi:hypothetical protein